MRLLPFFLALCCCAPAPLAAWGRQGHQIAAALALRDLPPALSPWFRGNEAILRDHCDDPDAWKWHDHLEGARHFLDTDAYGGPDRVPRAMDAARAPLGEADFERDGQLPWLGAWVPEARAAALDEADLEAPWAWLNQANALVAPLLRDDLEAGGSVPREFQENPVASAYWTEFNLRQGPVVREQLELAGQGTARMILLAWHLAGEPAAPWPVTGSLPR